MKNETIELAVRAIEIFAMGGELFSADDLANLAGFSAATSYRVIDQLVRDGVIYSPVRCRRIPGEKGLRPQLYLLATEFVEQCDDYELSEGAAKAGDLAMRLIKETYALGGHLA